MTALNATVYEIPGALGDRKGYRLYHVEYVGAVADNDTLEFPGAEDVIGTSIQNEDGTDMAFDAKSTASSKVALTNDTTTASTYIKGIALIKY